MILSDSYIRTNLLITALCFKACEFLNRNEKIITAIDGQFRSLQHDLDNPVHGQKIDHKGMTKQEIFKILYENAVDIKDEERCKSIINHHVNIVQDY